MIDTALTGTHILVVGGTGTLGTAITRLAITAGARVTITSRSAASAEEAAAAHDGAVDGVGFDVTDHETVAGLLDRGPFDHAVVTAADNAFAGLSEITEEDLDRIIEVKLKGIMWTARHLRPVMASNGSMLFISGMLSRRPTSAAPLAAINAAVECLAPGLAHEWAPLRVNVVSPEALGSRGVGGHDGTADDVASLIIATLANRWVNGTVLDIHGG